MTANLASSIAFKSSGPINVPCFNFSSSLKTDMPFCFKPVYKWSVNVLRVSSPLKLRNTSNFHLLKEDDDDDDDDDDGRRAIKEMDELE